MLLFSDVGSARTLPLCRRLGIPTVLSMVHGDVREEAQVLEQDPDEPCCGDERDPARTEREPADTARQLGSLRWRQVAPIQM